jgi:hypothetical protein
VVLSREELSLVTQLSLRHDAELNELEQLDRYYEGTQPLSYMHPELQRELSDRIRSVIVFWPQLIVDSVEERLDVEGFRLPGEERGSEELSRVWQANDLDEGSQMAHIDALVMRRSYVCVGTNEDDPDTPLVTPESPLELFHDTDPRDRSVRAALRRVNDIDALGGVSARYATLYLPNETIWCQGGEAGWVEYQRDGHGLGRVPVVPLVNRRRLRGTTLTPRNTTVERMGRSELAAVIPLSDAACKQATDMMVAGEFVSIPFRGIFGVGPEDLIDSEGNKITPMQAIMGRLFTIGEVEAKAFEFAAGQLSNFADAIKVLAQLVASISGLPPEYLGLATDNPASADAIRAAEARLIKRAERKQRAFGGGWEQVMRLVDRFQNGKWDDDLRRLEVMWRDAATPTVGMKADAAVKLNAQGIVPKRQTREDLGYTDVQIERMEEEDEAEAERSPVAALARMADQRVMPPGAGNDGADNVAA